MTQCVNFAGAGLAPVKFGHVGAMKGTTLGVVILSPRVASLEQPVAIVTSEST